MTTQRLSPPAKAGSVATPPRVGATAETRPGAPISKSVAAAKSNPVFLNRPTLAAKARSKLRKMPFTRSVRNVRKALKDWVESKKMRRAATIAAQE